MSAYLDYSPEVFANKTILLPCDDPEWSNFTKYFAQNFEKLKIKNLVSTSFAPNSKKSKNLAAPTLFEIESPKYDEGKAANNGKIFTLTRDLTGDHHINVDDLEWEYLEGDGDFNSLEIRKLRDEADIIVTNPPFSLFRDFLAWIIEAEKQFVILGNMHAITYKEVFPLIKDNRLWLGATGNGSDMVFRVPPGAPVADGDREKAARLGFVGDYTRLGNSCWFTNIEHGRRHRPLPLMPMEEILRFTRHKEIQGKSEFLKYENYDAIEVPYIDSIPSDYPGVMGVPASFLDKHSPEQFEIVGMCENLDLYQLKTKVYSSAECKKAYQAKFGKPGTYDLNASGVILKDGLLQKVYQRVLIRHRKRD